MEPKCLVGRPSFYFLHLNESAPDFFLPPKLFSSDFYLKFENCFHYSVSSSTGFLPFPFFSLSSTVGLFSFSLPFFFVSSFSSSFHSFHPSFYFIFLEKLKFPFFSNVSLQKGSCGKKEILPSTPPP